MTYLFGDSSPSDLDLDYIEFLRDALDFSVQVLAADERIAQGAARTVEVRRDGEREITRLEQLGAAQMRAIQMFDAGDAQSPTAQCAQSLLRDATDTVKMAADRVRSSITTDVARIEQEARRDRERCSEALATFLQRHDLPHMSSELRLHQLNGMSYQAHVYLHGLGELRAVMELSIPSGHLLSSVVRVDRLMERLEVHAPESGGWLRKEVKLRPQRLEKEFITALSASDGETLVQLRSVADGTGMGFDLVIPDDRSPVILRRVGEGSELPPFELDDGDSMKVRELKEKLLASSEDLKQTRTRLVEASFGDAALSEHRDPKAIVQRLVAEMAPVVREIARRSLAPTELVIKRQTGDGRREEIFVSRRDLQRKLLGIGAASRAVFAPLDLGELPPEEVVAATQPEAQPEPQPAAQPAPRPLERIVDLPHRRTLRPGDSLRPRSEKSLFAEAMVEDDPQAIELSAQLPPQAAPPPASVSSAEPSGEAQRLDDSLERLLVNEETHKPE
jgi:hypothetical protein